MQALTNDPKWATRTNGLLAATGTFFQNNVMAKKCEQAGTCNVDQLSFKAYLSRWLAATSSLLPSTAGTNMPLLQASAGGAVASCAGGPGSATCGTKWFTNSRDGTQGAGQQLAALEVVHGLLVVSAAAPSGAGRGVVRKFRLETTSKFCQSLLLFYVFPLSSVQRCIARRFL
jgi:mannan endo-1,6-alpha-mannosidase